MSDSGRILRAIHPPPAAAGQFPGQPRRVHLEQVIAVSVGVVLNEAVARPIPVEGQLARGGVEVLLTEKGQMKVRQSLTRSAATRKEGQAPESSTSTVMPNTAAVTGLPPRKTWPNW